MTTPNSPTGYQTSYQNSFGPRQQQMVQRHEEPPQSSAESCCLCCCWTTNIADAAIRATGEVYGTAALLGGNIHGDADTVLAVDAATGGSTGAYYECFQNCCTQGAPLVKCADSIKDIFCGLCTLLKDPECHRCLGECCALVAEVLK